MSNAHRAKGAPLDRLHATLAFDGSLSAVAQVSSNRASVLASAMDIHSVRDLLYHFPLRYLDMSQVVTIQGARIGNSCTLVARLYQCKVKRPRAKLSLVELTLVDATGTLIVTCFNQPWLAKQLTEGQELIVSGTVEFSYGFKRMTNPLLTPHEPGEAVVGVVLPLHPATQKISRNIMRRIEGNALELVRGLHDPLPLYLRRRYRLYSRYQALRGVHAPLSLQDAQAARRRLRYEELFFLELELATRAHDSAKGRLACSHVVDGTALSLLRANLPFALTEDQASATRDILARMSQPKSMDYLLLGDVGTGKTMVAAHALAAAADSGTQALMMGPTEVLVQQYAKALGLLLDAAGISWDLLTGSTEPAHRTEILERLKDGSLSVLFGTHALLERDVVPHHCSLVVIDEQQRFGVAQRDALRAKALGADALSLSATPIPRSLALTLYGSTTLGFLRQAPAIAAGRTTHVCHFSEEGIAYDALRAALERGEQAYIICPLIGLDLDSSAEKSKPDASEQHIEYAVVEWGLEHDKVGDTLSAATMHAKVLQEQIVPQARVGLLHGRLSADEKQQVMDDFRAGKLDVLVSTTVVEVGVDVPGATLMIIEDADRFGLAQLHQLRGRVGRGKAKGEVYLVSRSRSEEALSRLALMEQITDGFALAEHDLALRREGDVLGLRQHGKSPLKLVNVVRDAAVIEAAAADAKECLFSDALTKEEKQALQTELARLRQVTYSGEI